MEAIKVTTAHTATFPSAMETLVQLKICFLLLLVSIICVSSPEQFIPGFSLYWIMKKRSYFTYDFHDFRLRRMAPAYLPHGHTYGLYPILTGPLLPIGGCKVCSSDVDLNTLPDEVCPCAFKQYMSYFLSMICLVSVSRNFLTMLSLGLV